MSSIANYRSLFSALDNRLLLRIAIISSVLGGSLLLAIKPSPLYLAGLIGIVGLLVFMRYPEFGLLITLLGGFAIPYYGPSGLNITMLGVSALLGLWLFEQIVYRQPISWVSYPFMRPMFALVFTATISFAIGQLPWFHLAPAPLLAQVGALFVFILSVGSFLLVAFRTQDLRWLRYLVYSFMLYAPLKAIEWLVPEVASITAWLFQYGSDGSQFWFWLIVLIFSQALFNRNLPQPVRAALWLLLGLLLYVNVVKMSDWKSGWIPALAAIGFTITARWPKTGIVGGLLFGITGSGLATQRLITNDAYSYSTRLEAWDLLLEMVKVNPLTGLGPANYYRYTPLYPIRGYDVEFNSHSQYIDLLLQTGVLGLAAYLWVGIAIAYYGWGVLQRVPKGGFAHAYVLGALGGLGAMYVSSFLGDWILPFFYNVSLNGFRSSVLGWIFLGGLVAIDRLACQTTHEGDAATNRVDGSIIHNRGSYSPVNAL